MTHFDPTVRRQELGAELRTLRKAANYTLEQAARIINVSTSKVSRMETGHRNASVVEVSALLAIYRADGNKRDQLLALARESDEIGWWQPGQKYYYAQRLNTLTALESNAEQITCFDLAVVPGILQTGEYAHAIMAESDLVPEDEIEARVLGRVRRQSILMRREPPKLLVIIDELALKRIVGGNKVTQRQLERLVREAHRPSITLRVVPNAGRTHPGVDGSFLLFYRSGFPLVVSADTLTSSLLIEDRGETSVYELALRNLLDKALAPEESLEFVAATAKQLDMEARNGCSLPTYTT
jgi:transcriptional regulator with XRE-family HTH domain